MSLAKKWHGSLGLVAISAWMQAVSWQIMADHGGEVGELLGLISGHGNGGDGERHGRV